MKNLNGRIASLLAFAILVTGSLFFFFPPDSTSSSPTATEQAQAPQLPRKIYGFSVDSVKLVKAIFKANENLGEILSRYKVPASVVAQIGQLPEDEFNVRRLKANKPYTLLHNDDSIPVAKGFVYHPNPIDYVVLRLGDSVSVEHGQHPVDTLLGSFSGTIETSLYQSLVDAGGSPEQVNQLADVYAWVIDFFGLQKGDCFKLVYEKYLVKGEAAGLGPIQAAYFFHEGKEYSAYRFDQGQGPEYFDEAGNSLRKTFLKAPLSYSRISSRFSYSRLHPILKIRRPHLGVDYAAPRGTPVLAVGDGVVTHAAYGKGAGHMIKVRHNSNYVTGYLHLAGYAKGIKKGAEVKQGQVIGYVGSTGLSTGPHLDFRFWKNGVAVDPLKIDPPSANPILPEMKLAFEASRDQQQRLLDAIEPSAAPMYATVMRD